MKSVTRSDPNVRPAQTMRIDGIHIVVGGVYGIEPSWKPEIHIRIERHYRTAGTGGRWRLEVDGKTRFFEKTLRAARIEASCLAINARGSR